MRCLIDSMVFDAIAADRELLVLVDQLTRRRRLELLAAAETMTEIAAVPDEDRRRRLQRVRVLVVPPAAPLPSLMAWRGVSDEDAAIAAAAAREAVPLVTEDRDLRDAVRAGLPQVAVWTFAADLLPRVTSLAPSRAA